MCSNFTTKRMFGSRFLDSVNERLEISFNGALFFSTSSDEKSDLHELCTTDSSSEDEQSVNGTPKDTEGEEINTENVESISDDVVTEVDNAQEAHEFIEIFKAEKPLNRSEILSTISSNRSSNQSGTAMNVEALPEKNKR